MQLLAPGCPAGSIHTARRGRGDSLLSRILMCYAPSRVITTETAMPCPHGRRPTRRCKECVVSYESTSMEDLVGYS
eukprot:scaffold5278_cov21-Phaeocystis_antarctica.AAC.1